MKINDAKTEHQESHLARQWLTKRRVLLVLITLLFMCLGIYYIGSTRMWFESQSTDFALRIYQLFMPPLTLQAQPASPQLQAEVRKNVTIVDSLEQMNNGSGYQLQIVVKENESFVPVGLQVSNTRTSTTYIAKLSPEPEISCLRQASGWSAYRTDWVNYPGVIEYAYAVKKPVILIVRVDADLYSITGLEVSSKCFWAQE